MKKKLLGIAVILSALAVGACGFAACKGNNEGTTPPHEHAYERTVVAPTCTEQGYTLHTCDCGESYKDVYVNARGHKFTQKIAEEKYLKSKATCLEKAVYFYSCTNCGEAGTKTFTDGTVGTHDFTQEKAEAEYLQSAATCTEKAVYYKSCTACGLKDTTTFVYGEPAAHSWKDNVCQICKTDAGGSKGLEYNLNSDKKYYAVAGIGTCTDKEITIPSTYNGLPVTAIDWEAFNGCSELTSITIPDSITKIGSKAFSGCDGLIQTENGIKYVGNWVIGYTNSLMEQVTLKSGTKGIANSAFSYCYKLTSITIPDGVTAVGDEAFRSCSRLTSISIPKSVTEIGSYAFDNCSSLTSITIPKSVTSVDRNAFDDCSSLTIYCEAKTKPSGWENDWNKCQFDKYCPVVWNCNHNDVADNGYIYLDIDGVHYSLKDGTANLIKCFENIDGVIEIPEKITHKTIDYKVTSIEANAFFDRSELTGITIPDSVTSIGNYAFYGCDGVVQIEDGVKYVGNWVIGYTNFPEEQVTLKNGTKGIADNAFYNSYLLRSINIPDSVTSIGIYAFYGCSELQSITIPDSVTSIGDFAFYGCSELISITIPKSVTSIGRYAFKSSYEDYKYLTIYCEATAKPSGWDTDWNYTSCPVIWDCINNGLATDGYVYLEIDGVRYTLKDGSATVVKCFTNISGAIEIPAKLNYKEIEYAVTSIGDTAFSGYRNLTNVTIPDSITEIGNSAFNSCSGLISITIPESVTSIEKYAFDGCSGLIIYCEATTKPEGWDSYWANYTTPVIWDCNSNDVATDGYIYLDIAGVRYSLKDGVASVVKCFINTSGTIEIPAKLNYKETEYTVTSIGEDAFRNCSNLTGITIPDSVTSIGKMAFYYCSGLTSITIPDSVTSIGNMAFYYCSGLTSITIPQSVTSLSSSVFYGCDGIIQTENGVKYVGNWVIGYTDSLTEQVTLKNGTKGIADNAFSYCHELTSITIPDGVTYIGNSTFYYCSGLTSITIPDSVTKIGSNAFSVCNKLTGITIPDSVTEIGEYAFRISERYPIYCEATTKPEGWDSNWTNNTTPVIWDCNNNDVATDGYIYVDIDGLRYSLKDGSANVLECISAIIEAINIPTKLTYKESEYTVTSIGNNAFAYCSGLTSITIPDSVTEIGEYAFSYCSGLTNITIPDSITEIGSNAFAYCSRLTTITLVDSITCIKRSAFISCSELTGVIIPDSVTEIESFAFGNCNKLTTITFKGTLVQWRAITKDSNWDFGTGNFIVVCTDGKLDKYGNEIT